MMHPAEAARIRIAAALLDMQAHAKLKREAMQRMEQAIADLNTALRMSADGVQSVA